ncbi:MAG: hypothetical protein ABUK13_08960 [Gammaproteobacteria bacterium]
MADILGVDSMEIVLEAGLDDDDLSQSPDQVDLEYVQGTVVKGIERTFTLFDDIYLNYCLENSKPEGFKSKSYRDKSVAVCTANLTYIGAEPERRRYIAWGWLLSALLAMALAFVIVYVSEYSNLVFKHEAMLPVAIVLGVFGVMALIIFYYKTQHKVIYKSDTGQVPIFELSYMPRNKAYKIFIGALEQSIDKAHHRAGVTMKHRLVGELKYLRKMSEAGIIAKADYEKARGEIFRHKEYQV